MIQDKPDGEIFFEESKPFLDNELDYLKTSRPIKLKTSQEVTEKNKGIQGRV